MGENDSSRRVQKTLDHLVHDMTPHVERLERLRLELIDEVQRDASRSHDSAATNPAFADVQDLTGRLRRVVDWLEASNDQGAASNGWESWQSRSGSPTVPGDGSNDTTSDDRWWIPSLVLISAADPAVRPDTLDVLERWMRARSRLSHLVVDEIVDGMVDLSASPWPVVDDAGRPRFPIHWLTELAVPLEDLQKVVNYGRAVLLELELITPELAKRPVELGDVFAAEVSIVGSKRVDIERAVDVLAGPDGGAAQLAHAPWSAQVLAVAGHWCDETSAPSVGARGGILTIRTDAGRVRIAGPKMETGRLPILDVSWDAREQAKLAFAAANQAGGTFADVVEQVDQQLRHDLEKAVDDAT